MEKGAKRKKLKVRERVVKLVFSILSLATLLLLTLLKVDINLVSMLTLGFSFLLLFVDLLAAGVSKNSFNTEFFILIALIGLAYSKRFFEGAIVVSIYLLTSIIHEMLVSNVDLKAKKYGQSFRSFERDFFSDRSKYLILTLILLILVFLVLKFYMKLRGAEIIYRLSLTMLVMAMLFFERGVPLSKLAAMIRLCKDGIYLSRREDIEALYDANTLIFEKEALTRNSIEIHNISPKEDYSVDEIKELLAYGYFYVDSPLRPVFLKAYGKLVLPEYIEGHEEYAGGVSIILAGEDYNFGDIEYIAQFGIKPFEAENQGLTYYVIHDGRLVGSVEIKERLDEGLFNTIDRMKRCGISRDAYFSKDDEKYSLRIARFVGIEELYHSLKAEDRLEKAREIGEESKGKTIYVAGEGADESVFEPNLLSVMIGRATSDSLADIIIPEGGVEKLEEALLVSIHTQRLYKFFTFVNAFAKTTLILLTIIGTVNGIEIIGTSALITLFFLFFAARILRYNVI